MSEPSRQLLGALALASVILAYFSWKYIETPFRNKKAFTKSRIFLCGAIGSVLFVVLGLVGNFEKGYPKRLPDAAKLPEIELPKIDNGWCFYTIDTINSLSVGAKGLECWLGNRTATIKGVLFGDSFAGQYEPLWDLAGIDAKVAINSITTNWCYPSRTDGFTGPISSRALQQCIFNRKYVTEHLDKYSFVILGGAWGDVLMHNKMTDVLAFIDYASSRVKAIIIMASPQQYDVNVGEFYKKGIWFNEPLDITKISTRNDKEYSNADMILSDAAKKYGNIIFIDRASLFSVAGKISPTTSSGIPFNWNESHLSVYGSKSAAAGFLQSEKYRAFKRLIQ
jgi:hypothetical protein